MNEATRQFIRDHAEDDPPELLLNASRYQGVDIKAAVIQIHARKHIKTKLPEWYKDDRLIFPSTIAVEQSSSEITAKYKQRLALHADWLCDLTGGLGVDTYYLAQKVKQVVYVEKNKACCDAARENFSTLGVTNISVINGDAMDLLKNKDERIAGINVFYIDPSRRGSSNRRLYAVSDCEPDIMQIMALLPNHYRLIIKLSPMLDISRALTLIPSVREIHILSVKNECKELLLVAETPLARIPCDVASNLRQADPDIFCVNYSTDGAYQVFCFRFSDERVAVMPVAECVGCFLYEPNASVLKAGAYKLVASLYRVEKLHKSSHLYTSNQPVETFPGRIFEILEVLPFNNRICKTIHTTIPQANISVRNFPLSVDALRKRTRIHEGGELYLYATTLQDNQKVLIKCRKFHG